LDEVILVTQQEEIARNFREQELALRERELDLLHFGLNGLFIFLAVMLSIVIFAFLVGLIMWIFLLLA
jgi:hypothetical protein